MYAIVDLGSNSFHVVIAEKCEGRVTPIKTLSSKVQLAEGIEQSGKISKTARQRAILAFQDFQQELTHYPIEQFCVVGTNALRVAKNAQKFMQQANGLGFPINVISGEQEAFYIYRGVQYRLPAEDKSRLVFDIGGGSTEFAVGRDSKNPELMDSLSIGCVSCQHLLKEETLTHKSFAKAREKLHNVLDKKLHADFYRHGWQDVYASSGTAKMLSNVLRQSGISDGSITLSGLVELEARAVKLSSVFRLNHLPGLKANRRNVFASGLTLMHSIMEHLDIKHVEYCDFALREGVLLSLVEEKEQFPLFVAAGSLACRLSS